jgi:hypothetical protein
MHLIEKKNASCENIISAQVNCSSRNKLLTLYAFKLVTFMFE